MLRLLAEASVCPASAACHDGAVAGERDDIRFHLGRGVQHQHRRTNRRRGPRRRQTVSFPGCSFAALRKSATVFNGPSARTTRMPGSVTTLATGMRSDIFHWVSRTIGLIGDLRRRGNPDGVAVGLGLGRLGEGDVGTRARLVHRDQGRLEVPLQERPDHGEHDVAASAGRETDQDVDRFPRVVSRLGEAGHGHSECEGQYQDPCVPTHACFLLVEK